MDSGPVLFRDKLPIGVPHALAEDHRGLGRWCNNLRDGNRDCGWIIGRDFSRVDGRDILQRGLHSAHRNH